MYIIIEPMSQGIQNKKVRYSHLYIKCLKSDPVQHKLKSQNTKQIIAATR